MRFPALSRPALMLTGVLLVTGCSGTGCDDSSSPPKPPPIIPSTPTPSPSAKASASPAPTTKPSANPSATPKATASPTAAPTASPSANGTLYVANGYASQVLAFASPQSASSKPSQTIAYPSATTSVATDGRGTIAVVGGSSIYLYHGALTSSSKPFATLSDNSPGFVAFDSGGNLYATTFWQGVLKFAAPLSNGETGSILYVADHGVGIAIDANDVMYVANTSGDIDVVKPPYANNSQTVVSGPPGAMLGGVALHNGSLWVGDTANQEIYAYALPLSVTSGPSKTFTAPDPEALAFDAAGNLFVSDDHDNGVDVYAPPSGSLLQPLYALSGTYFNGPYGLTFGP